MSSRTAYVFVGFMKPEQVESFVLSKIREYNVEAEKQNKIIFSEHFHYRQIMNPPRGYKPGTPVKLINLSYGYIIFDHKEVADFFIKGGTDKAEDPITPVKKEKVKLQSIVFKENSWAALEESDDESDDETDSTKEEINNIIKVERKSPISVSLEIKIDTDELKQQFLDHQEDLRNSGRDEWADHIVPESIEIKFSKYSTVAPADREESILYVSRVPAHLSDDDLMKLFSVIGVETIYSHGKKVSYPKIKRIKSGGAIISYINNDENHAVVALEFTKYLPLPDPNCKGGIITLFAEFAKPR